jgi:AraC family transcriptional regulator
MTIDAELKVPEVTVQVARFQVMQSSENSFCRPEGFWLDLSITPRTPNARVCFKERWASHRFEPPGRLFMLPPGEVLKTRSDGGSQTSVICLVQKHLFQQWLGDTFEWTERRLAASLNIPCEAVQRLLSRLGEEARHPGFASQAFSEAMAIQIVIELSRYYLGMKDEPAAGGLSAWRLRLIDERLREVRSPPTLTDLAALCGLSVRQLSRGFRVNRACSIGDYISQTRIENAKRLLLTGETVKSIAFSMGFGSPSGFCYAFRRATGRTPRQYRQQEALSFRSRLN